MQKIHSVSLLLVGIALGCGAATVAPTTASWADPGSAASGGWACYVVDRFPDIEDARFWDGAANIEQGLNMTAENVASGTILPLIPKGGRGESYPSVACIKH